MNDGMTYFSKKKKKERGNKRFQRSELSSHFTLYLLIQYHKNRERAALVSTLTKTEYLIQKKKKKSDYIPQQITVCNFLFNSPFLFPPYAPSLACTSQLSNSSFLKFSFILSPLTLSLFL